MNKNLKRAKRLHLHRETVSLLTSQEIGQIAGGSLTCFFSCAYACQTIGYAKGQEPCTA